jgi:hypothetical protein
MSQPTMQVNIDKTDDFKKIIAGFQRDAVLVGIPEETGERKNDPKEKGEISNAALLAINNFGSPINNIPPRPVMQIGIRNAQAAIAEHFKTMARDVWSNGEAALQTGYERAGITASNEIKKAINNQEGIAGPAASTLASRKSDGFKGTKALIRTGQMRNAITYVVRSIWGK